MTTIREQHAVARGGVILFPLTTPFTVDARSAGSAVLRIAVQAAADLAEEQAGRGPSVRVHRRDLGRGPRAVRADDRLHLQYAFRRHYDAAPMSYLRRVRLERAHAELQAADPAAGDTVAAIARRWGFARPDRFVVAYRAVYGRPPSHTLRG